MAQIPIAEGVFSWPSDNPQLIGSKCTLCTTVIFPAQGSCPRCGGVDVEDVLLERRGELWTWTTQSFPPIAPPYVGATDDEFSPFGIGWVALSDQLMVEARLTESDPTRLRIGMPVELVIEPVARSSNGDDLLSFAFRPAEES